jgi:hypothetical protein
MAIPASSSSRFAAAAVDVVELVARTVKHPRSFVNGQWEQLALTTHCAKDG